MRISYLLTILFIASHLVASSPAPVAPQEPEHPVTGLLIFLDDSEDGRIGALSGNLIQAIYEEAGPIIASASLLVNIRGDQLSPEFKDLNQLTVTYNKFEQAAHTAQTASATKPDEFQKANDELANFKYGINAILAMGAFNAAAAQKWVIKKISSELYLLIPTSYLTKEGVDVATVGTYVPQGSITSTEQKLGLKINHMPTANVSEIQRPSPAPATPDYFMNALPNIFVAGEEYSPQAKGLIPFWSIFVMGHGSLAKTIVGLKLGQFKDFLTFLENKIFTRLLVYASCYGAGVNNQLIYGDAEKGISKTFSFPIITQALIDAPVTTKNPFPTIHDGKIQFTTPIKYDTFFQKMTQAGTFKYNELIAPLIASDIQVEAAIQSTPQIRFPGLPWFSVLDAANKTVAIGAIMAKTRTEPLDVASYFKKQGKEAEPLGILLYAHEIPFELVIDAKNMPRMVSMIPGNALHRIKTISSGDLTIGNILGGFDLKMNGPSKRFIIDELTALRGAHEEPITYIFVIVDSDANGFKALLSDPSGPLVSFDGATSREASLEESLQYTKTLLQYGIQRPAKVPAPLTAEQLKELQANIEKDFAQPMTPEEAIVKIRSTVATMPNGAALRIPRIDLTGCASNTCVNEPIHTQALRDYKAFDQDKLLKIDLVTSCDANNQCIANKDIVYQVTPKEGLKIYFEGGPSNSAVISRGQWENLPDAYMPLIDEEFKYFEKHHSLSKEPEEKLEGIEKRSTQQLLTPEAIKKLNDTVGSKVQKLPPLSEKMQMLKAAQKDDIDAIEKLVATANVAAMPQATKDAALAVAGTANKLELAQKLVGFGANVNGKAANGDQILAQVANAGSTDVARFLLEKGVDVNSVSRQGVPALAWAMMDKHYDIARLLIRAGAKVNVNDIEDFSVLATAAEYGQDGLVHLLVEKGADVNWKGGEFGKPVLAIAEGSPKIMRYLIGKGARVDEKDNQGLTILMLAAEAGNVEAVKTLLTAGADKNIKNDKDANKTAYDYALVLPNATKQLKSLLKPTSGK